MSLWVAISKTKKGDDSIFDINFEMFLKVFYMIVCIQSFIKIMFFIRIYPQVGFMIKILGSIMTDLKPFFIFVFIFNVLFGTLFMILNPDIGGEYSLLFTPFKWLIYVLRNGLHDFSIDDNKGFLFT
jgi:hypothetical protein